MTCLDRGKRFYRGVWKYRNMIGHTSPGCGTAKIPVRINCPPEITLLTLKGKEERSEVRGRKAEG
jgi:predicted MPP superfamily phosphohydrolase